MYMHGGMAGHMHGYVHLCILMLRVCYKHAYMQKEKHKLYHNYVQLYVVRDYTQIIS